jgi:F-type H+-transporting ATPase subunit epsilon
MDGKITLEIVTPQGVALRQEVDDVQAPSVDGEFGVLPGHLPLLAALRTGVVSFHHGGEETRVAVGDGFVEVSDDKALLLTDQYTTKDAIDVVRVRLDLKEADEALDKYTGVPGSPEWQQMVAREVWAATQLELFGDPPPATQRPFEAFGPPAPPEEDQVDFPEPRDDLEAEVEAKHPDGR